MHLGIDRVPGSGGVWNTLAVAWRNQVTAKLGTFGRRVALAASDVGAGHVARRSGRVLTEQELFRLDQLRRRVLLPEARLILLRLRQLLLLLTESLD